jgi:hypothetical protein
MRHGNKIRSSVIVPSFRWRRDTHDFGPSFLPVHVPDAQFQGQRACATKN